MALENSETDHDEIRRAASQLWDYFGRMGGAARYRGMMTIDIYVYVATRLLARHTPTFNIAEFVDQRFESAAEKSLERASACLAEVKSEGSALLAHIFTFVREIDSRLKPEHRNARWDKLIKYLEELPTPISRGDAHGIAAEYISKKGGVISKVLEAGEDGLREPRIYDPKRKINLSRCWVAYLAKKRDPKEIAFKSSEIVVVSKETGKILYFGSAHDEG